jgi:hypothetical protein
LVKDGVMIEALSSADFVQTRKPEWFVSMAHKWSLRYSALYQKDNEIQNMEEMQMTFFCMPLAGDEFNHN